jgi:hypothetical protein
LPRSEKHDARLLLRHVVVDRDDVDVRVTQRFEDVLKLVLEHREVSIDRRGPALPPNAAQVFTPIASPTSVPCMAVLRPKENFASPYGHGEQRRQCNVRQLHGASTFLRAVRRS